MPAMMQQRATRTRAFGAACILTAAVPALRELAFVPYAARAAQVAPRVVRLASESGDGAFGEETNEPTSLQVPLVNYFTNNEIIDCLMEGCSQEKLSELEEKLKVDEEAIAEHVGELRSAQEKAHSPDVAEAFAWFRTFTENSEQLRDQLEEAKYAQVERVRAIKNSQFASEFAASLVTGDESQDDYLNEGAISIWRMLSRSGKSRSVSA